MLCLGLVVVSIDATIVSVALPWIRTDLGFTPDNLVWIIDSYMIPYGGLVLLGGKLGDLWGHRRVFLVGVAAFTVASLICGLARAPAVLLGGRIAQGCASAAIVSVSFPLLVKLYPEGPRRVRAVGIRTFAIIGGSGLASLMGGVLTSAFNWHWIFFVNVPIGLLVIIAGQMLLPADLAQRRSFPDIAGAASGTASISFTMYGLVKLNEYDWDFQHSLLPFVVAITFAWSFIRCEKSARDPIVPLAIFRVRSLRASSIMGLLWAASVWAWFVIAALHLQQILNYSALQVGLAFLPMSVIAVILPLRVTPALLGRFGLRKSIFSGMLAGAFGMLWFMGVGPGLPFLSGLLPGVIMIGVGIGLTGTLLVVAGIRDVASSQLGLASGLLSASSLVGAAMGLATFVTSAAAQTRHLLAAGAGVSTALIGGYRLGYVLAAGCAAIGGAIGLLVLKDPEVAASPSESKPTPS